MLIFLLMHAAAPEPRAVEWEWRAPAECPDGAVVERRFRALAPRECQRGGGEPLRVTAVATQTDRRWDMALTLRRGASAVTRSLTASTCEALAEATAVIAATACPALEDDRAVEDAAVDEPDVAGADAPSEELEAVGAGVAEVPEVPAAGVEAPVVVEAPIEGPMRPIEPPASARRTGRRRPGLELGGRLAIAWGPTPSPAVVAGAALRLQWPAAELLLALDGSPRRRFDGPGGRAIDLRAATATIAGCPTASFGSGRGRGRVSLCLGAEVGALVGTGVGTPVTRTAAQPWLAALVGPSLTWSPHARFNLGAAVDVAASFTRPAFSLAGYDTTYRAPAASVRLRMFFGVQLW